MGGESAGRRVVLVALPVYVVGEHSLYGLEVRFHEGYTVPVVEYEVRATRSLFVNRNAFATVMFRGLVAAVGEFHQAFETDRSLVAITVSGVLLAVNGFGLAISFGRALWAITPLAVGIYLAYLVDRRAIPFAVIGAFAYLVAGIYAVLSGLIPLSEGTPTRARKWYPAVAVPLEQSSLLGEGLVAPGEYLAEHSDQYASGSPHNSYISIFVRTGLVEGFTYLGIVDGSLLGGLWRYRDVIVAVLALAVGYAAHQVFEA